MVLIVRWSESGLTFLSSATTEITIYLPVSRTLFPFMVVGNRVLLVKASGRGLQHWVRDKGLGRFTSESLQGNRAPGDVIEVVHHVALAGFDPPMITNDAVNFGPTRCHTL
jgi:hypothetical protein